MRTGSGLTRRSLYHGAEPPPCPRDSMKIASFNINGVKARLPVLLDWLRDSAPDVACLQEIKSVDAGFPRAEIEDLGYSVETHGQKGFNGVAILSKLPLEDVSRGLPGGDADADWPSGGEGASAADLVGPALERLSAQAHHRAARGLLRRAAGLMADGDHEARPARAARRPLEPFRRRDARALALPRRPRRAPPFPPPPCPHAALPSFT